MSRRGAARIFGLAVCLAGAAWASSAAAEPGATSPPAPTASEATGSEPIVAQAWKAYQSRDYERARVFFERAYALDPGSESLLGLALAEYHCDRFVEARGHLAAYITRPDATSERLEEVKGLIAGIDARLGHVRVHAPQGAEIRVDGAVVQPRFEVATGGTPVLDVVAGSHEVTVRPGNGLPDDVRHVVVRPGEPLDLEFEQESGGGPKVDAGAGLSVPILQDHPALAPGAPASTAKWITVIGLGSAALVSAAVATGFAVAFQQNGAAAASLSATVGFCGSPSPPASCAALHNDQDAQRVDGLLATGLYAGAAAATLAAVGAWVLWPSSARSGNAGGVKAVPLVGSRSAGMMVVKSW